MRYFSVALLLVLFPVLSSMRTAGTRQVVRVSNLENLKGIIYIGWYASAADFRKADKACLHKTVKVEGQHSVDISFENVPPGVYAVAVFLDENDNGKIDTNFLGIPREKYGFSNNKYPLTRAATFQESAFAVGDSASAISIRLKG